MLSDPGSDGQHQQQHHIDWNDTPDITEPPTSFALDWGPAEITIEKLETVEQPPIQLKKFANSKRGRFNFGEEQTDHLLEWLSTHADHPYPDGPDLYLLKAKTGLKYRQIRTWLVNNRSRKLQWTRKPPNLIDPDLES
jgi:hypothetical protein